jgi:hypothetical protein
MAKITIAILYYIDNIERLYKIIIIITQDHLLITIYNQMF